VRITLIVNAPDPATVDQFRDLIARLRKGGNDVQPLLTFEAGDARRMACQAAADGRDLVVAAGGDGTINEVVNGLHDHLSAHPGAPTATRLGLVPLGTGNDLAAALQIPTEPDMALAVAVSGEVIEADVATVNGRCFINVSTGGFGAEATEETPEEVKRALGSVAYVVTGVKKFATLEVSHARFGDDETIYQGPFLLFAVGNSRRTGAGNWLTPRADLTDGRLDLCVVREMSRLDFIRLLPDLRAGSHVEHPAVIYRQVRRVVVESDEALSVNADGEPLNARRLEYGIHPRRIPLVVPDAVRAQTGQREPRA
jgi:diacylglycerol kinase (ATP)